MDYIFTIGKDSKASFNNYTDYCIGTGRMGLALQKEYFEQLRLVQEKIGFKYIRGHGLFADDMAIYHEYTDDSGNKQVEYNFTYLDFVMDSYLSLNIRPFIELGFMPEALASGEQTIFYWKGNVTPPKSYEGWTNLVTATLSHLLERYGRSEVIAWPIEVWNEPNLAGFWKGADMAEYFKLFNVTFKAIKELNSDFRIGGPAICGVDDENWMREFLKYCKAENIKPDFITRHHYTINPPVYDGHYGYPELVGVDESLTSLTKSREIIDSFDEFKNSEIHITEFNTSYSPKTPVHDTNYNAAYIAHLLSKMGDVNRSYSYWTFGDIFEESGVPFTPFHGGFGLVANGQIPKPTFWTFEFYKRLTGECVHKTDNSLVTHSDGKYKGILWNDEKANSGETINISFDLPAKSGNEYYIMTKTVDEAVCNPLKAWHDMGEPSNPMPEEIKLLRDSANPLINTYRKKAGDKLAVEFTLNKNAVVYFEVKESAIKSDRGYSYERATEVL